MIKYDFKKDEPIRNEQGWCTPVKKGKMLAFDHVPSGNISEFLFNYY